jgi:hypothetical protein
MQRDVTDEALTLHRVPRVESRVIGRENVEVITYLLRLLLRLILRLILWLILRLVLRLILQGARRHMSQPR